MHHTITNLLRIKEEINLKDSRNIKIIAVSKTFNEEKILPLIDYGHLDFGENKVQEAISKWTNIKSVKKEIKLHMLGKLQSNKVKHAVKIFDYIHSLDNYKLAKKISEEQAKIQKSIKLFIQVNIGNENQKSGINQKEIKEFLDECKNNLRLNIVGLMCIPPNNENSDEYFDQMQKMKNNFNINELSMGMSNDYLNAIKFGSTMVRIGSKIFGNRN
tara:strand:- start:4883 stop:5530 length:648 start_codon:yes stop_codon:yes gene_type:complete